MTIEDHMHESLQYHLLLHYEERLLRRLAASWIAKGYRVTELRQVRRGGMSAGPRFGELVRIEPICPISEWKLSLRRWWRQNILAYDEFRVEAQ